MFLKRLNFEYYLRKNHVNQKKRIQTKTQITWTLEKIGSKLPLKTKQLSSNKNENVGVLLKRAH